MAPSLRILAGSSASTLQPVAVNHDTQPSIIDADNFKGRIAVRIKGFNGEVPEGVEKKHEAEYFEDGNGKGMSWSMQIQGRFLKPVTSEDLVFGNQFDKPIKDSLPYGTSLALQFVKVIDPSLEHDLYADQPWAFSPLIATMNRVSVARLPSAPSGSSACSDFSSPSYPPFPTPENDSGPAYTSDDVTPLFYKPPASEGEGEAAKELDEETGAEIRTVHNMKGGQGGNPKAHDARRSWFGKKENREKVTLGPQDVVTADFFNGFIDFNTLSLHIPFSGGLGFDLRKYWDGQPVRYLCKDKKSGTVFFCIQFEITDPDT